MSHELIPVGASSSSIVANGMVVGGMLSDPIIFRASDGPNESYCWLGTGGSPGGKMAELILGYGVSSGEPLLTNHIQLGSDDTQAIFSMVRTGAYSTWTDVGGSGDNEISTFDMKATNGGNTAERTSVTVLTTLDREKSITLAVNSDTKIYQHSDAADPSTTEVFRNGNIRYHSSQTSFGIFNKASNPALRQIVKSWRWAGDNVRVINELLTAFENYGWLA